MTAPTSITARPPASLESASALFTAATAALGGWHTGITTDTHTYVADGVEAIRCLDDLIGELHRVRASLVTEMRRDEDDRAARVDRLLAAARGRATTGAEGPSTTPATAAEEVAR